MEKPVEIVWMGMGWKNRLCCFLDGIITATGLVG